MGKTRKIASLFSLIETVAIRRIKKKYPTSLRDGLNFWKKRIVAKAKRIFGTFDKLPLPPNGAKSISKKKKGRKTIVDIKYFKEDTSLNFIFGKSLGKYLSPKIINRDVKSRMIDKEILELFQAKKPSSKFL